MTTHTATRVAADAEGDELGSRPRAAAWRWCGFFVAAVVGGVIGRLTLLPDIQVVLISPSAGVAFLWLGSGSPRTWRWDIPGLCLAQVVINVLTAGTLAQAVVGMVLTPVQAAIIVWCLWRWAPSLWGSPAGTQTLASVRDLSVFLAACAGASLLTTVLRSTGLGLLPTLDGVGLGMAWVRNFTWAMSGGLLGMLIAPSLVIAGRAGSLRRLPAVWAERVTRPGHRLGEALLIYVVTALLYAVSMRVSLSFVIILITVWAGLRLSPIAATAHAVISGTVCLLLALNEVELLAQDQDMIQSVALAQAFAAVLIVTAVAVSLVTQSRQAALTRAEWAEHDAEERASLMRAVIVHLHEGVVVLRADGEELVRNPAGTALLNLPRGRPYDETMPGPDFGMFDGAGRRVDVQDLPHSRALRGIDSPATDFVVRTPLRPEGLTLEITATHLRDTDPVQAVINFRDVTAERQERDALASFAGVLAHDLSNPLLVASGWSSLVRSRLTAGALDTAEATDEVLAGMERVQRALTHMHRLIDDLLGFTLAKDQPLRTVDVDLTALVREVAVLRQDSYLYKHEKRPRVDVQEGLCIHADPGLVRQLIDNLVGNAMKYVAPGVTPRIRIDGRTVQHQLELRVSDNGIGIPVDMRDRVFASFQRAHRDGYSGTGLGLAICRRIVERHGGTIFTGANLSGHGTQFILTLPAVNAAELSPALPG